ncbi:hypothetical protein BGX26_003157 [Mortierella sp. AD094]|nr:hypothetical protein BGX26_003157 [Mortierella sp. AD094]
MTSDAESVPDNPIDSSLAVASDDDRGDSGTSSDPSSSPAKGKNSTFAAVGAGNRGNGSRGPIGPRPGVFRPCARCRVKKTKCDRVKPTCSNCLKSGGSDTVCVYDNDEPAGATASSPHDELPEGAEEEVELPPSPLPSKVGTVTSKHLKTTATTTTKRETTVKGQSSSKPQSETTESITAGRGASKSQGSHRNGNNNQNSNASSSNGSIKTDSPSKTTVTTASNSTITTSTTTTTATANGKKSTTSSQSLSPASNSSDPPIPAVKKIKTGSASSAAIRPSPLRTSITTATPNTSANNSSPKSPPPPSAGISSGAKKRKASMSNGSKVPPLSQTKGSNGGANGHFGLKEEEEDDDDASYLNEGDDVVFDLSVKELEQDQENEPAPTRPVKRDAVSRPSKAASGGLSSKSNGSAQGRIMVELARQSQPPPAPIFVIDKNQKARKWGKSGIVFQTLGGVVSIPLWTSDQEMLLNEPKPLYLHQSVPMMTTGRKDSSLARLAVLSQLDMDMDLDSPERGNTPDSLDGGSPGPTIPSFKKKRGSKKPQSDSRDENTLQGNGSNKLLAIKKALQNKRARADSGNATVAEDLDGDDDSVSITMATNPTSKASSARSTPAPTQQRPRTFPCSFEGCSKSFMDKFHLDRHEARHVTEEIVCGIDGCTKAYNSISTVRRHQSMMHKDKKLQMDAAAAASATEAEAEAEAEMESSNSNNSKSNPKDDQANGKKVVAKKGKSKSTVPTSPAAVPVALMLKDVKDSAYRPWMDSTESSTRTSSPLKETKHEGFGVGQLKHHKSSSSTSSTVV